MARWKFSRRNRPSRPRSLHQRTPLCPTIRPSLIRSLTAHDLELLDSAAPLHLGSVHVALGVDRQGVRMRQFADLVADTAKTTHHLPGGMVEDGDLIVMLIGDVHKSLCRIAGKGQP